MSGRSPGIHRSFPGTDVHTRTLVLIVTLLGAPACSSDVDASLRVELARYNRYVAHQWGDSIASMFASEGELEVPGRASLRGRTAIREFLSMFTNVRVDSSAMWADSIVRSDSGFVLWGGYFQRATLAGRPPVTARGGVRAAWQRGAGRWELRRMETF
jgi:SnoaL-like domain